MASVNFRIVRPPRPWLRVLRRVLAGALAVCLAYPQQAGAAALDAGPYPHPSASANPESGTTLAIPSALGFIREAYDPRAHPSGPPNRQRLHLSNGPTVFLIQDLHADETAQRHVAALLEQLSEETGTRLVGVEGAHGRCETDVLASFPDPEINRRVASLFLQEGLLTGAEYQAIVTPRALRLHGIESPAAYLAHLRHFTDSQARNARIAEPLDRMRRAVNALQAEAYPTALLELERRIQAYETHDVGLTEHLNHLFWLAGWQHTPLDGFSTLSQFRDLSALDKAMRASADPTRIAEDREELRVRLEHLDLAALSRER
jgi:hypothetical protein